MKITGYQIMRTLGRGGMATVYLAEQESMQREIALKVMSTTLLGDERFSERFLREARIAARLRHPNVVQVHDVGASGEQHYMAMEFLPGGPVIKPQAPPRPPDFALRVIRQIASALDYAGQQGIVHRDIKPDNILLREDGNAVLTDFGIARAADTSRMTGTGLIIGTPNYMSPEQARGHALDGRSDLYSLGIVLYEMLTGHVPYQATDSIAVGVMHLTAEIPRLPSQYEGIQPLLEGLLAKDPSQRFQTGGQVVTAIDSLQHGLSTSQETRILADSISGQSAAKVSSDGFGRGPFTPGQMTTPPPITPTPTLLPASTPAPSRRRIWAGLLALVLAAGALAWYVLTPSRHVEALLQQASSALEQGQLTGTTESARESYLAVLALDPDNPTAQLGLREVGRRLTFRAKGALSRHDTAPAQELLELAESLGLPAGEIASIARTLEQHEARDSRLAGLLNAAKAAIEEGRFDGSRSSALALYRRVLELDPGNQEAIAGLRHMLSLMLEQANQAMAAGDTQAASAMLARIAAIHAEQPKADAADADIQEDVQPPATSPDPESATRRGDADSM